MDALALGEGFEIREGYVVLGGNPFRDFFGFAYIGVEPALGIGDLDTMVDVHVFDAFGIRVIDGYRIVVSGKHCPSRGQYSTNPQ